MLHREIPGTGIRVSEVGFGGDALATGWWGDHDDDDAVRLLHAAMDRGITLFDCADRDGDGPGRTWQIDTLAGRIVPELLPDGTFVTTTYGHWTEGEAAYVVSVRFMKRERAGNNPRHTPVAPDKELPNIYKRIKMLELRGGVVCL